MIVTRDIVVFIEKNDADMRALAAARTGIHDKAILDELMSRTYAAMLAHKTLSKWIPKRGRSFETYVATILLWEARKMGEQAVTKTVCIDNIPPLAYDPRLDPARKLKEHLRYYDRYLVAQVGLTGAYDIGTYLQGKLEGYADHELGFDMPRIRRLHRKWLGNYQADEPA